MKLTLSQLDYLRRLARDVWWALDERHLGLLAAGVAFYSMFAIFPGMAAMIAIWGLFADPAAVENMLGGIRTVIPDQAYGLLTTQLHTLIVRQPTTWQWATLLPLGLAMYSVHNAVLALISGLNAVEVRRHRSSLMRHIGSFLMTLALLAVILVALAIVVTLPIVLNLLEMGWAEALILRFLPWVVLFLVVKVALGLFYRFGPTFEGNRHGWVSVGSMVAAFLWAFVSFAFSLYLENFNSYNRVYGSIGAVIALMMWLYLSAYIVLLGAVLNAEIARSRLTR